MTKIHLYHRQNHQSGVLTATGVFYVLFLFPVILVGTSLGILLLGSYTHFRYGHSQEYQQLLDSSTANDYHQEFESVGGESNQLTTGTNTSGKNKIGKVRSYTEIALNICGLSISLISLYERPDGLLPIFGQNVIWLYLTLLATIRTVLRFSWYTYRLWYSSVVLYCFLSLSHLENCISTFILTTSNSSLLLAITSFLLSLSLSLLILSTPALSHNESSDTVHGLVRSREPPASILSKVTLSWFDDFIRLAYTKVLTMSDVWDLDPQEHGKAILRKYRLTKIAESYGWSLFRHLRTKFLAQSCWTLLSSLMLFLPPVLMRGILNYIDDPESHSHKVVWLYAAFLLIGGSIGAVAEGQSLLGGAKTSLHMRSIMIGEIYAKALRRKMSTDGPHEPENAKLSKSAQQKASNGVIINLMAVDAIQVADVGVFFHYIPEVPIQLFLAVFLLFRVLGVASLIGIFALLIILPLNYYVSSKYAAVQKEVMKSTDKRVTATNEVLQSIRIIKYFAWEMKFRTQMDVPRRRELKQIRKRFILYALGDVLFQCTPLIVTLVSFWAYTFLLGKELIAPIAFTSLSLFNLLRLPLDELIEITTRVIQAKISLGRISAFLGEEETEKYTSLKTDYDDDGNMCLELRKATLTWGSGQHTYGTGQAQQPFSFYLYDIDVRFLPKKLNLIIGPTGSGKSSLLLALLGEMTLISGEIFLPQFDVNKYSNRHYNNSSMESVAYCAQQSWLLNDSIRENILFSQPFNRKRYNSVITACALKQDFEILSRGDKTEIGDKGITLSGGQKQRISLARALYSPARHLLLDDCLSAVDSHTAQWIFDNCIIGELMDSRTCILVTHNVGLCIASAERVVVMSNGRIVNQGTGIQISKAFELSGEVLASSADRNASLNTRSEAQLQHQNAKCNQPEGDNSIFPDKVIVEDEITKDTMYEEQTAEGRVSWRVYQIYLKAFGGSLFWLVLISAFILQQFSNVSTSWWIQQWVSSGRQNVPPEQGNREQLAYFVLMYSVLGVGYAIITMVCQFIFFSGSLRASRKLYELLANTVIGSKLRFFDITPLGRIMNRFSKDIQSVDQQLAPYGIKFLQNVLRAITIVVLISIITPYFLIVGVLVAALFVAIGIVFVRCSRELKRLDSITRSPIFSHFEESIVGTTTIRAYGDESRFIDENLSKVDTNNRPYYYNYVCGRWITIRTDIISAVFTFAAAAFAILSIGRISSGLAGMSLTFASNFAYSTYLVIQLYALNEMNLNSVERISEYTELEEEAPAVVEGSRPSTDWPQRGDIDVENLSLRYDPDLPLVVQNASFHIEAGSMVGIVGRTGAGKSSIVSAFFRLVEFQSGRIIIDKIDISTIGLHDLRSALTIIPQDPTLFKGTIRSNLDPFGDFEDAEMFQALRRVNLHEVKEIRQTAPSDAEIPFNAHGFNSLESPGTCVHTTVLIKVAEGGTNLSQGQRQLMCLARSLLKMPRIILMDEATASIDYEKIQHTIRKEFSKSTIITIAHRLRSIIDYDKIIVLDKGRVVESDTPQNLIRSAHSMFRSMCQSSGELETLEKLASRGSRTSP